jgi:hypothetical protein
MLCLYLISELLTWASPSFRLVFKVERSILKRKDLGMDKKGSKGFYVYVKDPGPEYGWIPATLTKTEGVIIAPQCKYEKSILFAVDQCPRRLD